MRTAEYFISFQSFSLLCHFRGEVFLIITFFNQPTKIKVQQLHKVVMTNMKRTVTLSILLQCNGSQDRSPE